MSPELPWSPSARHVDAANVTRFMAWLARERDLRVADYDELWRWSVDDLPGFWRAVWDFYGVRAATPPRAVLEGEAMPGFRWFPGARLNYAEHVLARAPREAPAILAVDEQDVRRELWADDLAGQVGALARALRALGVGPGDRVVGCLPHVPETIVAMLATTSIGAVWAVCAPDFGAQALVDRFAQLEPKVLFAVDGYRFAGRDFDRRNVIAQLRRALPTLEATIVVGEPAADALRFADLVAAPCPPAFTDVDVEHPLWVLFSSGTTGVPKGIVHSHGGILLEHLKGLGLCLDLRAGDRYLFPSSTSWMAWNFLVGGLLHGATVVAYDGSPGYPEVDRLWRLAAEVEASVLGMGSAYVTACLKSAVELRSASWLPADGTGLSGLRTVIPTGSPLPPSGWEWLARELPADVRIDSICGGTEVCTAFLGGSPLLPVRAGAISGRWLGVGAQAWDDAGCELPPGTVGEFVVTTPMPSMPTRLWNDPEGARYRASYFEMFPGVWRQGDWISIDEDGFARVLGRSDATLNKAGVRMGSAEIYAVVDRIDDVFDALVVGVEEPGGEYYMPLFVVAGYGDGIDDRLAERIRAAIRTELSPRHVPTEIVLAPAIPKTLTGKKLEVPIKRLLQGQELDGMVATGAVDRPDALEWFADFARRRRSTVGGKRT